MKHFIFFLAGLGFLIGIFYSCKRSFLNSSPLGSLSTAQVANKQGVEGLLIGAYSLLDGQGIVQAGPASSESNWVYGSICGTEAYKGSFVGDQPEITAFETFTSDASNDYLDLKWQAIYEGVQSSNDVIRVMRQAKDMTSADT